LGGEIHLSSEPGKGSVFTVVLPEIYPEDGEEAAPVRGRAESRQVAFPAPSRPEPPAKAPVKEEEPPPPPAESGYLEDDRKRVSADSKSLLIVEDDQNFARIMLEFARERGFDCVVAEDGETGLHFADYYRPSAIILDIGLPGIDGWTVMERLKDNPKLRHIPVHFMSASDSSLDAMRMGAIGYLTKPVSMEKIEQAFAKFEHIISEPASRLLLVEDDKLQRQSITQLIGNGDVETTSVGTGREALLELEKGGYDCMILDLGLEDMSGFQVLEKIRQSETASRVPVIIYTGRDLTRKEEKELNRYTESIIVKGVKSPERLLDETALFLHRVEADLPENKRNMLKMVHEKEAVLSGKTILLADDDMRNVFALSSVLEERDLEVIIARNGLECLEKLEESDRIDAVLMDIMMPEMDGYEAMREIRKQKQYAKLPIIALTAKAMKGDRSKCIEAGASDYLAKPVNTDKLISMLRVWLY
jgi:CheY-like chemotaxis protein